MFLSNDNRKFIPILKSFKAEYRQASMHQNSMSTWVWPRCTLCRASYAGLQGSFKNQVDKMRWVAGQKCMFLSTFRLKSVRLEARHSGYSFFLTSYSWSLILCYKRQYKNRSQSNDNLNETIIQNTLLRGSRQVVKKGTQLLNDP